MDNLLFRKPRLLTTSEVMRLNEKRQRYADLGPNYIIEERYPTDSVKRVFSSSKPYKRCTPQAMPSMKDAHEYMLEKKIRKFLPINCLKYSAKILFKGIRIEMGDCKAQGKNEEWYRYSFTPNESCGLVMFKGDTKHKPLVTDIIPATVYIDVYPRVSWHSMQNMYCLKCHSSGDGHYSLCHCDDTNSLDQIIDTNIEFKMYNARYTNNKNISVNLDGIFKYHVFDPSLKIITNNLRNSLIHHKPEKCYSWTVIFMHCGDEFEMTVTFATKLSNGHHIAHVNNIYSNYECTVESTCENPKLFLVMFDYLYKYYKTMYEQQDRMITPSMLRQSDVFGIKYLTNFQRGMWLNMRIELSTMADVGSKNSDGKYLFEQMYDDTYYVTKMMDFIPNYILKTNGIVI